MAVEARPIQPVELYPDISDDYRLMVEGVLPSMGWTNPEEAGVPALEQVQAGIESVRPLAGWLLARAEQGIEDQLVIARTVGGNNGIGVADTINRLDPKAFSDGYVWGALWGNTDGTGSPYKGGDKAAVHDNAGLKGLGSMWDVAVLLGDKTDPATGRKAYDNGLAYTSKTVREQLDAFGAEAKTLAKGGIEIVTATVGHMAVDSVSLRVQGKSQRGDITRLIHYPAQEVDGFSCVPSVDRFVGRLYFYDSCVGGVWNDVGARRLVRVPITPLEA
jgi:hypothetical protein